MDNNAPGAWIGQYIRSSQSSSVNDFVRRYNLAEYSVRNMIKRGPEHMTLAKLIPIAQAMNVSIDGLARGQIIPLSQCADDPDITVMLAEIAAMPYEYRQRIYAIVHDIYIAAVKDTKK